MVWYKNLNNVNYAIKALKVSGRFSCPNTFNQEGETYGFQEII
jgi:hypothetical protein